MIFLVACLTSGCVPGPVEPGFSGTVIVTRGADPTVGVPTTLEGAATQTVPPTSSPQADSIDSATETLPRILTLTLTPWDPDAPVPSPTPVPPLPGLVYRTEEGLWRVPNDWQPELLADRGDAILSPEGRRLLYLDMNDIWLLELDTGERRNLTQGSNRQHCCPQWWPANPEKIIFGSWPIGADLGPGAGYLSAVRVDGSDYTILDSETPSNAMPALHPDGTTIAYDRAGTAWLFQEDQQNALDPAAFGLSNIVRIAGPSWSPDGSRLAWTVAVNSLDEDVSGDWRIAVAIMDLETNSHHLLHPYKNSGRGGWFPPPAWSPDGRWLAFVAEDENPEDNGLWVVASDNSQEFFLGPGTNPIWSPDNRWLTFNGISPGIDDKSIYLVQAGTTYKIRIQLPPGAFIAEWIE